MDKFGFAAGLFAIFAAALLAGIVISDYSAASACSVKEQNVKTYVALGDRSFYEDGVKTIYDCQADIFLYGTVHQLNDKPEYMHANLSFLILVIIMGILGFLLCFANK